MAEQHRHQSIYIKIWLALCVLTAITVSVAYINLGQFNGVVALSIATFKAWLVCWFFMHLKEDTMLNRFIFFSSLVFLLIFIGLTLSDTDYRGETEAAKVTPVEEMAGNDAKLHEQFKNANPELVAYGKNLFAAQCQTCHGANGKGDGPAAAALNPKPRDFTSGYWKQGGVPSQVFLTISKGIAGTGMPPFEALGVKDRWALAHFVRSLSPNTPAETTETWTKSGLGGNGSSTESAGVPKLPIDMAMQVLVKEAGMK